MENNILEQLKTLGNLEENVSFKHLTTFRVGGTAKYVFYPTNIDNLMKSINILKDNNISFKMFGNGSNILCSSNEYDGVIIKLNRTINSFKFDDNNLYCEAGCSIIALASQAALNGLSGLEFASGIPGTLGGCIFMNAGAFKSEMKNVVKNVLVLENNEFKWLSNTECEFSYRSSYFKSHPETVILGANLTLIPKDKEEIIETMNRRRAKRMDSQPQNYPCAGSIFRNPANDIYAWQLIDQIGYRGVSYGDAYVSEIHSNFIVNRAEASSEDIDTLICDIQNKVKDKFNIDLICEVEKFNWKK